MNDTEKASSPEKAPSPEEKGDATKADPKAVHIARELKHGRPLIGCRFDPSGRFVFASSEDNHIVRWDLSSGDKVELVGHNSWSRSLAFTPDSQTLVTGGYEGQVIWWPLSAQQPKPMRSIKAHDGWVRAVAISPGGKLLASAGNDLVVKLWNVETGEPIGQLTGHKSHIYNLAFHPSGEQLVSADLKGNLIDWDIAKQTETRRFKAESIYKYDTGFRADIGGIRAIDFSDDGSRLATAGITNVSNAFAGVGNPSILIFDWKDGKRVTEHLSTKKLKGVAWGVVLHADGFTIGISGGGGGDHLLFWSADSKDEMHQLKLPNTARDLAIHPNGLDLAIAHHDGRVRICRMQAKAKA